MLTTLQIVQRLTAEHLCIAAHQVLPESSFFSLGADSLDQVEMVMLIEDEFHIVIPDEDFDKISTAQQAAEYIDAKCAEKQLLAQG